VLAINDTGSNPTCGYCVPTQTPHAVASWSVNEYLRKLGSKWANHEMNWSCSFGWCLKTEIGTRLWKDFV